MSFRLFRQLCLRLISGVFACSLVSCATFTKEKSGAELRKEGYEILLQTVKPGMYRRQLYAVLPPYKKPAARPPFPGSVYGLQFFSAHQEKHALDEECHLVVHYQLKNRGEYPSEGRLVKGKLPTIDELLYSTSAVYPVIDWIVPSKENPNDIILSVSGVCLKDDSQIFWEETLDPTQEHGVKFGREMESRNDFPFRPGAPLPFTLRKPKAVSDRPPLP